MQVVTRNNKKEPLRFDKITDRIKGFTSDLSDIIDPTNITQQIVSQITDGINTRDLDELSCLVCLQQTTKHPDYGKLAARIAINNHHKDTCGNFKEFVDNAYINKDVLGNNAPLVSEEIKEITDEHYETIQEWIDYDRDYNLDCFGFKTLHRAYLLKTLDGKYMERPGDMLMRVSLGIHGWTNNGLNAKETYDYMSNGYFVHATPTLFHSGTPYPQMSSCFLMGLEDSVAGIYGGLGDTAQISKHSGGIGIHIHDIRGKNSYIRKTAGFSNGIFPMLKVYNDTARYINQGGKRNGSFAIYLEPHHPDIIEFLESKKPQGADEMRARDLFYAMWISDLFMNRVKEDKDWCLFCPDRTPGLSDVWGDDYKELYEKYESEGKATHTMKARELWEYIINSQIETGGPYMLYKDAINRKSNQQNIGTIKSSNLCCVSGDTPILTDKGHIEIKELDGQSVNVWNGEEFSEAAVFKTNDNEELIDIKFSDGMSLRCTKYHKFVIKVGGENKLIEAIDLKPGDKLIKCKYPIIDNGPDIDNAYTQGYFSAIGEYRSIKSYDFEDGINYKRKRSDSEYVNKVPCISIRKRFGEYPDILSKIDYEYTEQISNHTIIAVLNEQTVDSIPQYASLKSKMKWFSGFCEGKGRKIIKNGCNNIEIFSEDHEFICNLKLFLQTCGINPNILLVDIPNHKYDLTHYILLSSFDIQKLKLIGFELSDNFDLGYISSRNYTKYIKVENIYESGDCEETYCFNEPKKNMGIFNGIYAHNCEITEYSDPEEYAVCNLASIGLPKLVNDETGEFDYSMLRTITKTLVRNLNLIIDKNYYPLEKCRKSNLRHRPIGIGVQGLANTFVKMGHPYDSIKAREVNIKIFQNIYYAAVEESHELSQIYGSYETFEGSPMSNGLFQFDMWNIQPDNLCPELNWENLRTKIKLGMRNSLLLAPMPTASTSQILGYNECFEPFTNNIYTRRTLAGEFVIINEQLIRELIKLRLWNEKMKAKIILNEGSIQSINCIPDTIKALFKTAWEMKQKSLLDLSIDRGPYICQSQSLNVFVKEPTFRILNNIHFYGWENGLKTGTYYIHSKPASKAQNFTIDPQLEKQIREEDSNICEFCSA